MFRKFLVLVSLCFLIVLQTTAQTFSTPEELTDADGQFAEIDGVRVYYRVQGDTSAPVVMLIHGFGGSTFSWRETLPALADAGFYAVALDLPPFGLSDKSPDLDFSRSWMADIVAGLMDELGIEQATIVGHSMGGAVTAQFAVRHPDKVNNLVFVAGGVFEAVERDEEQESQSANPLSLLNTIDPKSPFAPALLRTLITRDFFIDTIKSAYYDPTQVTEEIADGYAKLLLMEDAPVGFLAYLQAQEESPISLSDLVEVATMPTLILWGEQDTWVGIELGETMRDALPNVSYVTFEDVGHLPMEETPEAFNASLIAFLQANS